MERLGSFRKHSGMTKTWAVSADGHRVLCSEREAMVVCDVATGSVLKRLPVADATHAEFFPSGTRAVVVLASGVLTVWDLEREALLLELTEPSRSMVKRCAVSSDECTIVTCARDRLVRVWDASSGQLLRTLVGHEDDITCCAVSPDCQFIVTCSWNTSIVWCMVTGRPQQQMQAHGAAFCASWATPLVLAQDENNNNKNDVDVAAVATTTAKAENGISTTANDDGGDNNDYASAGTAAMEEVDSGRGSRVISQQMSVRESLVDDMEQGVEEEGKVKMETEEEKEEEEEEEEEKEDEAAAAAAAAAAGGKAGATAEKPSTGFPGSIQRNADGTTTIRGVNDSGCAYTNMVSLAVHDARVWRDGKVVLLLKHPSRYVECAFISPCGRRIVTVAADFFGALHNVYVWDGLSGKLMAAGREFQFQSEGLFFSRDGSKLIALSNGGVDVWKMNCE